MNTQYLLSIDGDKDTNGANIVLKYVPNGSAIPDSALFMISGNKNLGIAFLMSKLSFNSSNIKVIECQKGGTADGTKITCSNLISAEFDSIDKSVHQLWTLEDPDIEPEIQSWDLVDISGHCDWDGTTKYLSYFKEATQAWNDYIGKDRFRPDTWYRIEAVKISDATEKKGNPNTLAETYTSGKIVFYTTPMDALDTYLEIESVVMHELGHALGLDHSPPNINDENLGHIMNPTIKAYGYHLSLTDKASYQLAEEKYFIS